VSASRQSLAHLRLTNVVRLTVTFEAEGPHMGAGVTVPVVSEKRQKKSRLESGQIVPHRGDRVSSRAACCSGAQSRRRRATAPQLSYLGTPGHPLAVEFKLRRRTRTLAQAQRTVEAPIQMRRRPRPRNAYGMS
jgi:hypothetical protein